VCNFDYLFYAGKDADQGGPLSLVSLWLNSTTSCHRFSHWIYLSQLSPFRLNSGLKRWLPRYTTTFSCVVVLHMASYYNFATHIGKALECTVYHFTRKSVVQHKSRSQTTILGAFVYNLCTHWDNVPGLQTTIQSNPPPPPPPPSAIDACYFMSYL
jgi:hypothetical protein